MKTHVEKQNVHSSLQAKARNQTSYGSILQAYKDKTAQRQSAEEEELLQGKFESVQKMELDEEEPVQGKFETAQLATEEEEEPLQRQPNNTGLPDNLKSGIENLSGYSMDDVKVHYNSSQPATLQAHAYAQGTDIHIAPGQEKHLPHEAWHVVQQKQGRVKPTMQMKGTVPVNDDEVLEKEADVMGTKAMQFQTLNKSNNQKTIGLMKTYPQQTNNSQSVKFQVQKKASNQSILKQYKENTMQSVGHKSSREQITQLQAYTMKRDLPLTKQVKDKTGKDAWTKHIDALKRKYPLPSGKTEDVDRDENFISEREILKSTIDINNQKKDYKTTSAHVAGIDMGERKRSGTGANKIKKIAQGDWIGAHLVKDAWGGLDNMMNVVAWPQAAEDTWSGAFEDQIDDLFLNGSTETGRIYIEVSKEDELFSAEEVSKEVAEKTTNDSGKDKWMKQEAEKKRWEINNAIETVPQTAIGAYELEDKMSDGKVFKNSHQINNEVSGFDFAKAEARKVMTKSINDNALKVNSIDLRAIKAAKEQEEVSSSLKKVRSKERIDAIIKERENLRPTLFSQDLEDIKEEDYK